MRTLTAREKRTVAIGAAIAGLYLFLLGALEGVTWLEDRRREHADLQSRIGALRVGNLGEAAKREKLAALVEKWKLLPESFVPESVVARARSLLLSTAVECQVGITTSRETSSALAERESGRVHVEGMGPSVAVVRLLSRLDGLGLPLIVDRLTLDANPQQPDFLRLGLDVVVLNPNAWKPPEASNVGS
jgi:hypothetical protein